MKFIEVRLDQLQADPNQPRKEFPEQEHSELAASMRRIGQMVPIIVVMIGAELWKIIDGERRWRASQLAGLTTMRALVLDQEPDESEICDLQLTINCERQDLNPLEKMEAYKKLMLAKGFNATELAKMLNKSKSFVTRILSHDRLTEQEKVLVAQGKLGSASAYALTRMEDEARREAVLADVKVPTKRDLERRAKQGATGSVPKQHHLRCELTHCSVAIRAERSLTPDELIDALSSLIKACRQAKAQQLDLSTLTRILRDQANARRNQEGAVN